MVTFALVPVIGSSKVAAFTKTVTNMINKLFSN